MESQLSLSTEAACDVVGMRVTALNEIQRLKDGKRDYEPANLGEGSGRRNQYDFPNLVELSIVKGIQNVNRDRFWLRTTVALARLVKKDFTNHPTKNPLDVRFLENEKFSLESYTLRTVQHIIDLSIFPELLVFRIIKLHPKGSALVHEIDTMVVEALSHAQVEKKDPRVRHIMPYLNNPDINAPTRLQFNLNVINYELKRSLIEKDLLTIY